MATGDRHISDRSEALPGHVIDDVEHVEPPATGELVVDEVQVPAGLGRASTRIGTHVPTALRRSRRLRTPNPSSR